MAKKTGHLITFEGTEGAGKSTLIQILSARLKKAKQKVILTREPGGNPVAERIRTLILEQSMDPWTELFLYEAARAEHLAKIIRPALALGKIVLCDRFTDSSLAYQSYARGLPWTQVELLNQLATQGLKPHLTVWVDIDPETGLKRATHRNRFEEEGLKFQTRVRKGFQKARAQDPERWIRVNSGKTPAAQLVLQIENEIRRRFL